MIPVKLADNPGIEVSGVATLTSVTDGVVCHYKSFTTRHIPVYWY